MELRKQATLWLAAGIEAAGALVIGLTAIEAFARALIPFLPRRTIIGESDAKEAVRLKRGLWLAFALELGADILGTAVVLRTALNAFPHKEIDAAVGSTGTLSVSPRP